jgi:hypothetical protein
MDDLYVIVKDDGLYLHLFGSVKGCKIPAKMANLLLTYFDKDTNKIAMFVDEHNPFNRNVDQWDDDHCKSCEGPYQMILVEGVECECQACEFRRLLYCTQR